MPAYSVRWVEIARDQLAAQPIALQAGTLRRIDQLAERPHEEAGYDPATDLWTTTYGGGAGILVYAVVEAHHTILIMRIV